MKSLILLGLAISLAGQTRSTATNFSADIAGQPDTRPSTWGTAGVAVWPIKFTVAPGYRVRVLRVYGDFLVWPKGRVPEGTTAGALFSLHTSDPATAVSSVSDLLVDNCFLYIQTATSGQPARAPFDAAVEGGLLSPDNTLYVKVAAWLNDTGLAIHMEPTWVMVYRVEDGGGQAVAERATVTKGRK